ncbi:Galacturan 1,4-alpha-galacturonidase [Handroanthus impetiginosus]|uniref:Galacturan 1,4-alpha-galacturonidase n=1 Tax=Handroanthus impetiginosus TaxID=429701 RepID=A0A2G9H2Y7_9LAMI|nr:Galacturan 1,4-alpha-galacturonidase [Handroanthus impetiginosus]
MVHMDSYLASPWIFLINMFLSFWIINVHGQTSNFIVTDFGAIADGKADNSQAFSDAWKKACETEGGRLLVPVGGGSFYVSGAQFKGPCTGQTIFRIDGTIIASDDLTLDDQDYWITFHEVDALTLSGNGFFDGNGASSWSHCAHAPNDSLCIRKQKAPTTIKINYVTNASIRDINLVNSKMFHLHIHESENVIVDNVHITAPEDSPNTDGIHIGDSFVSILIDFN